MLKMLKMVTMYISNKLVLLQVDLIHFGTGSLGKEVLQEVLANKPAAI